MKKIEQLRLYCTMMMCYFYLVIMMINACATKQRKVRRRMIHREIVSTSIRRRKQHEYLRRLVYESDVGCIDKLRMDRRCFHCLCKLLTTTGGLRGTKNVGVEEMTAMFLNILAHHGKNRVIKFDFLRSGETVSRHFHAVLKSVILCHSVLLKKPEAVPENSNDYKWKWFTNCLGALDGTHIRVNVPIVDRPRYRSRKSEITTNVLAVCSQDMQFIYVLSGWEGSAHDGRVLRDAVTKPNGLRVPEGFYYLVDAGYANCPGFLAPFRGQRYHLSSWADGHQPQTPQEFFNMKHASARNVIERTFGLLKCRWKILSSPSFYNISTQRLIINACCLLHNFIRREMVEDPAEDDVHNESQEESTQDDTENITAVDPTDEFTQFRLDKAINMFNTWQST